VGNPLSPATILLAAAACVDDGGLAGFSVLAVDPGRDKCGLAVVDGSGACVSRRIVPRGELGAALREHAAAGIAVVVVGDRTGSRGAVREIEALALFARVATVDEHRSTEEARRLYFEEQPPRGLARLIPAGLRTPPRPVDDFSAWVLGRRFVAQAAAEAAPREREDTTNQHGSGDDSG
jgi:hypothetical protein